MKNQIKWGFKKGVKAALSGLGYEVRRKATDRTRKIFPSEPFEAQLQLIRNANKSEAIAILDLGANRGQTAIQYRAKFPNSEIYCFEPFPNSVAQLRKQFSDDRRVHIIPKAVARSKGIARFYINGFHETNSLFPRPLSARRYYPKAAETQKVVEVETIDIDSFLKKNNMASVDIIKLDIQGGELDALRGAEAILKTGKISLIYTEIMFVPHYEGAPLFHEIWSFLSQFGYSLFEIYDLCRATNGQLRYGNALFVSEAIGKNAIDRYPDEP
ncbi:MAG: FkbM family methyltransferase [Cyanobacteriota bacterium]|nr:FkbM family methyltransferase [Cyanobacteriota bacterium]